MTDENVPFLLLTQSKNRNDMWFREERDNIWPGSLSLFFISVVEYK